MCVCVADVGAQVQVFAQKVRRVGIFTLESRHILRRFAPAYRRVAWRTLEACWRRNRHTLRDRFKRSGVSIIHNYAVLPLSACQPDSAYNWDKLPSAKGASLTTINGRPHLLWQRPNTYRSSGDIAAKGMTRKVHRAVKHALDIPPRAYAQRQYFQEGKAYGKARSRYLDMELYLLGATHVWGQFWEVAPAYQ